MEKIPRVTVTYFVYLMFCAICLTIFCKLQLEHDAITNVALVSV